MNTQAASQAPSQGPHRFKPGASANPSGRTRRMSHFAVLSDEFARVHGRSPSNLEIISLKAVATLASKAESTRTPAEQAVRASNTMIRLLIGLGLYAKKPAKPARPSLAEYLTAKAAKAGTGT